MGHHSSDHDPQIPVELREQIQRANETEKVKQLKQAMEEAGELGATGEFPDGKMTEQDEGEIAFGVGAVDGQVVINFKTPVNWLGMFPDQARNLARGLLDAAQAADIQRKDPA